MGLGGLSELSQHREAFPGQNIGPWPPVYQNHHISVRFSPKVFGLEMGVSDSGPGVT